MGDDYAANGRSYDCAHLPVVESSGERAAYAFGVFWVLKNERALKVARAVKARCELKMAFEQCARLLKDQEQLISLINWPGV
jgi:hypothetical protein